MERFVPAESGLISSSRMATIARTRELEAALAAVPDSQVGQILFGRLIVQPRPATPHAIAAAGLSDALGPTFRHGRGGPGGWVILGEPEIQFGPHVLVPDVAGWLRDADEDFPLVPRLTRAPEWVCEILSPSTDAIDRDEKSLVYAANEVRHLWFVDPIERTVEVLRNERGRWTKVTTIGGDELARLEPFEAVAIDLRWLWRA